MNVVQIAAGMACGTSIALLMLAISIKSPEVVKYEQTITMLMNQEGLSSEEELHERFPIFIELEADIKRIDHLSQLIQSKSQSPSPTLDKEESLQLKHYMQKIQEMKKGLMLKLSHFAATYAAGQSPIQ